MKSIKNINELREWVKDYERLRKLAKSLHRLYEAHCEYDLTPRQWKRLEKMEAEVKEIASKWGLIADICSDPRGAPVCLVEDEEQFRYSGIVIPF